MTYKAKAAVCSEIRTKHSTQGEQHVEFFNDKTWWYVKKPLGFKRLRIRDYSLFIYSSRRSFPFQLRLGRPASRRLQGW
jgi:hypothetical protein